MSIVVLQLPVVKRKTETRPEKCPYCHGETFQRWGKVNKPVRDNRRRNVRVYRYRCCSCGRTFRHYPQGVDQADQTLRMRKLAAVYRVLGMSLRSVVNALAPCGVKLSHMSVWRDLQEQADVLEKRRHWKPVRVLGLDGAYVRAWGDVRPVLVAVDLGEGKPVAVGYVDEYNPQAVRRWVGRTLKELRVTVPEEWVWVIDEAKFLITELPLEGSQRLFELWKQIPERRAGRDQPLSPLDQLRLLLIRLSEHWPNYRVFDWQTDVPWANYGTEQVIGRMKIRSKTVRGYKSQQGMLNALMLAGTSVC